MAALTPEGLLALAGATAVFALIPGPGIMAVVGQALARGFGPAVMWTAGQTVGDMVYLLAAMLGLGAAAAWMGEWFALLRYAGAAYLVYLGVRCFLAQPPEADVAAPTVRGMRRSFVGGMCVSLGNPKCVAFYCGFLPAFVDMGALTATGAATVAAVMCPIVFGVPVGYAWVAARGRGLARSTRVWKAANRTAGTVLIGAGAAVAAE